MAMVRTGLLCPSGCYRLRGVVCHRPPLFALTERAQHRPCRGRVKISRNPWMSGHISLSKNVFCFSCYKYPPYARVCLQLCDWFSSVSFPFAHLRRHILSVQSSSGSSNVRNPKGLNPDSNISKKMATSFFNVSDSDSDSDDFFMLFAVAAATLTRRRRTKMLCIKGEHESKKISLTLVFGYYE